MRITVKVSGAGSNGMARIPCLDIESIDSDLCTNGKLDAAKCCKALSQNGLDIQIGSHDGIKVLAFGVELVKQTIDACKFIISNRRGESSLEAHDHAECKDDVHAKRNLDKGRVVYVRQDITFADGKIRFRLDIQNPNGVVGCAENVAMDYALIVARVANHIADDLTASHGSWAFEYIGGPGCPDVFEGARQRDTDLRDRKRLEDENIAMWKCERRTASGHCSPCKFDCPHFKAGMCVELEVKK